jgi:hypothetical protein
MNDDEIFVRIGKSMIYEMPIIRTDRKTPKDTSESRLRMLRSLGRDNTVPFVFCADASTVCSSLAAHYS